LNKQQVEEINCKLTGTKRPAFIYEGGLKFVIDEVKNLFEEFIEKESIIWKAAYLWYQIASKQMFADGNKRTGYVVSDTFLELNQMKVNSTQDEKTATSKLISQGVYTIDHVQKWITRSLK